MKIYLASDHAGFYLKEKIKDYFYNKGFIVDDFGAKNFDQADNYPDIILPCIKQFMKETSGNFDKGFCIVLGGSGTGEAIVSNRVRGARAVVYNGQSPEIIRLGRQHNNCNVLSLGARFIDEKQALEAINIFQTTQFEAGRHASRVFKIDMLQ